MTSDWVFKDDYPSAWGRPVAPVSMIDPFELRKYSPSQPRDNRGRWTETGSHQSVTEDIGIRTRRDGGSSTNVSGRGGSGAISSGKIVSPYPDRTVVKSRSLSSTAVAAASVSFIKKNWDLLQRPDHVMGTWRDDEGTWFDVSVRVETHDEAVTLARRHNQKAYYDADTGQEVATGGTGRLTKLFDVFGLGRGASLGTSVLRRQPDDRRGDRGAGRGDREPALDFLKFNPDQPRDDWGRWTETGLLSPHRYPPKVNPSGRGGRPENPRATYVDSMPEKFKRERLAAMKKFGITPESIERELDTMITRAKKDFPEIVELGKNWYDHANERITELANENGFPVDTAIGITAAMSPQNQWGANVAMTGHLMRTLKADQAVAFDDDDMAWVKARETGKLNDARHIAAVSLQEKIRANGGVAPKLSTLTDNEAALVIVRDGQKHGLVAENLNPKGNFDKVSFSSGVGPVATAVEIARGADIDLTLNGHKVRSFYNNLSDPYDKLGHGDVTIDTHAVSAAQGYRMPATSGRLKKTFTTAASTASNQEGAYPIYADAFRAVAKKHGLTPNQAQAVAWVTWQHVRHEYPGETIDKGGKVVSTEMRNSTKGRFGVQVGKRDGVTPRYWSHVSDWKLYKNGVIDYATYQSRIGNIQ